MPLHVYRSNRMENLVAALADIVKNPLASPFSTEVMMVQSKGMQRWLAMELARQIGVWANCSYPFPNAVVWRLFRAVFPGLPDDSHFSPEVLTWEILGLLPGFLEREGFADLKHYLAGERDGLKRFQLAEKVADAFDQYTLFRPEMLLEWESGAGTDWQAILWRQLAGSRAEKHRGHLKRDFLRLAADGELSGKDIPERICVFGISYLPEYHLDVLAAAAQCSEVHIFLLSPRCRSGGSERSAQEKERHVSHDEGHPLLASLGRLGRDFPDMISDACNGAVVCRDLYEDPGEERLLAAIQSDILNLRGAPRERAARPVAPDDLSVQIHSCHSPIREMEVLYDNLLALMEREQGLAPRDIVVMTPDIETYAPYISMVFEGCQDPRRKIPYSIADRGLTSEGQIAGAVLKLLALAGGRLPVTRVFDILESQPVRRRFNLDETETGTIRGWLEETRIRWGMDENHRASLGLPGYRENSFDAGLDRLLLGYAMPDERGRLFQGILPYHELEGDGARTLGKLVDFTRRVAAMAERLALPRTLGAWRDEIRVLLSDFVEPDNDSAHEHAAVAGVVEHLGELGEEAAFTEKVELRVVLAWLTKRLAQEEKGLGFMSGGVTFCAMLPMRSIPFRVVALVGMNDGAFPRQNRPPGFDLISRHPRRGDRSLRDEDRYLFLESILSARDYLYISYVGQSIRDNSEIPPSVLVSEFLDALRNGYTAGESRLEERLVTRHRLQAFSREYFNGRSRLFSYSRENCDALRAAGKKSWQPAAFLTTPLKAPSDEWKSILLPRLLRFFDNPARFLLENRLAIRLEDVSVPLEERETFTLDGLQAYSLKQEILETLRLGGDAADLLPVARSRGILPPGQHGKVVFENALDEVKLFASRLREQTAGRPALEPLDFDLAIGEFRLSGRLEGIWPDRKIRYRCAKLKAKDEIRLWIEHAILNTCRPKGLPRESLLLMSDGSVTFRPVENAREILETILDHYWQGLAQLLRFFPISSLEYARGLEWNLDRAKKKWEGDPPWDPGEKEDAYFRLCFGREDPFTRDFEQAARTIAGPLVRHQT